MSDLAYRNILFISPEFFGIDKVLIQILEDNGAKVTWINERSVHSSIGRALNSVSPKFFYYQSNHYYKKKIDELSDKFDIIFIIKGDMVTKETIALFRKKFVNVPIVLYLYDPVCYIKGILPKISLYDKVISFEPDDCRKYGFEFRPLFCDLKKRGNLNTKKVSKKKYDISFYGTMYGDCFQIVYQMQNMCLQKGYKFYSFCFLRGKFMGIYYWFRNSAFRKLGSKSVSYVSKSSDEIAEILENTDIILDANDIKQKGLTLRTLETLVSGKRMITTNEDIVNYDFYNPNNICVVDRKHIVIPDSFMKASYEPIDDTVLARYTAEGWIDDVFGKQ